MGKPYKPLEPQPKKTGDIWTWQGTAWCSGYALISDLAPRDKAPADCRDCYLARHLDEWWWFKNELPEATQ